MRESLVNGKVLVEGVCGKFIGMSLFVCVLAEVNLQIEVKSEIELAMEFHFLLLLFYLNL